MAKKTCKKAKKCIKNNETEDAVDEMVDAAVDDIPDAKLNKLMDEAVNEAVAEFLGKSSRRK